MAQEQGATLLGVDIPRSISDRPRVVRFLINLGRFMRTKPLGAIGLVIIVVLVLLAIFANYIDRVGPETVAREAVRNCAAGLSDAQLRDPGLTCFSQELLDRARTDITVRLNYPASRFLQGLGDGNILTSADASSKHWLGTDRVGRDVYSRMVHGSRLALLVGVGGAIIAVAFGTVFGVVSAYFGGVIDFIMQRMTDALLAFPGLILLLVMSQVVEDPNVYWTTVALGILGVGSVTRIARASVLATREEVYVMAAKTVGASDIRVMGRHILPNIVAPLIVIFTISIGLYILAEAGLAFIGLSDIRAISWGAMINEGRQLGAAKPQMALYIGIALTVTVLGFNLLGDALRDALDPRLRGRGGRAGF